MTSSASSRRRIDGVGIIRLYFHPGVKISDSLAQATAVSQAILRRMPPGVQPPIILRYTAASVPIVQMSLASDKMRESDLYDYGIFRIRTQIAVVQRHHAAHALRRHGAHGDGRSRPAGAAGQGPQPARRERGDQRATTSCCPSGRARIARHGLPRQL